MKGDGKNGNAPRSPLDRQDLKGIALRHHGLGMHQYTLAASMECAVAAAMAKGGDTSYFNNFAAFGGSGAARFFPEVRESFISPPFETGNSDPIQAYADLLSSGDERSEAAARSWAKWGGNSFDSSSSAARTKGQLIKNISRLEGTPDLIVQGRYDMVCPPITAWQLSAGWKSSRILFLLNHD